MAALDDSEEVDLGAALVGLAAELVEDTGGTAGAADAWRGVDTGDGTAPPAAGGAKRKGVRTVGQARTAAETKLLRLRDALRSATARLADARNALLAAEDAGSKARTELARKTVVAIKEEMDAIKAEQSKVCKESVKFATESPAPPAGLAKELEFPDAPDTDYNLKPEPKV